jgi:hypothetical protein
MREIQRRPVEWRDKAAEYWDLAQMAKDYRIREQFTQLAARYLDMAEKFEDRVVAAAILNAKPRNR